MLIVNNRITLKIVSNLDLKLLKRQDGEARIKQIKHKILN